MLIIHMTTDEKLLILIVIPILLTLLIYFLQISKVESFIIEFTPNNDKDDYLFLMDYPFCVD